MQATDAFTPFRGSDPHSAGPDQTLDYCSVTAQPQHRFYSFEELRLNDIRHRRGIISRPPTVAAFRNECNGLLAARLPPPSGPRPLRRVTSASRTRLGSSFITFRVGQGVTEDFTIHENLVTARSEFVRVALSRDWKEARERVIELPDDLPDAFETYQRSLYTDITRPFNALGSKEDSQEYKLLVRAYILGERFMDDKFQNDVVNAIIDKLVHSGSFDPSLTDMVYDNTPLGSPLRQLLLDIYAWAGNAKWLNEEKLDDPVNATFAVELNKLQMNIREGKGYASPPYTNARWRYLK
jgi:hypothetical protein